MKLPYSYDLPIHNLASVFSSTTNSYKFYWFLAILEHVKNGKEKINIYDIIIEMICEIWYPINYFRLSFGKQDKFTHTVEKIKEEIDCNKDIYKARLKELLIQNKEKKELKI